MRKFLFFSFFLLILVSPVFASWNNMSSVNFATIIAVNPSGGGSMSSSSYASSISVGQPVVNTTFSSSYIHCFGLFCGAFGIEPTLVVITPHEGGSYSMQVPLEVSASSLTNVSTVWYEVLVRQSGNSKIVNTTFTANISSLGLLDPDNYVLHVYANDSYNKVSHVSRNFKVIESSTGTGAGGGGAGPFVGEKGWPDFVDTFFVDLEEGEWAFIDVDFGKYSLRKISFLPLVSVYNARFDVAGYYNAPMDTETKGLSNLVYRFFSVNSSAEGNMSFEFVVDDGWYSFAGVAFDDIVLKWYDGEGWVELPGLERVRNENGSFFSISVPDFGFFAVDVPLVEFCGDDICQRGESLFSCPVDCWRSFKTGFGIFGTKLVFYFVLGILFFAVLLVSLSLFGLVSGSLVWMVLWNPVKSFRILLEWLYQRFGGKNKGDDDD